MGSRFRHSKVARALVQRTGRTATLVAGLLGIASAARLFVGFSDQHKLQFRSKLTGPLQASFLDDIVVGMQNPEVLAALSMDDKQARTLMSRCQTGKMNFVDFLSITYILNHMGGDRGMVKELASVSDETNTHSLDDRLGFYKGVLDAMTPDERSHPKLFKVRMDADVQARIARVADNSGFNIKAVEQFLTDFNIMRKLLSELGSGKSFDTVTRKLTLD